MLCTRSAPAGPSSFARDTASSERRPSARRSSMARRELVRNKRLSKRAVPSVRANHKQLLQALHLNSPGTTIALVKHSRPSTRTALQLWHCDCPARLWKVPAGQEMKLLLPFDGAKVPTGASWHSDCAVELAKKPETDQDARMRMDRRELQ